MRPLQLFVRGALAVLGAACACSGQAAVTELVTNGDFSAGLAGFTVSPSTSNSATGTCSFNPVTTPGIETLTTAAGFTSAVGTQTLGSVSLTASGVRSCVLYQDIAIPVGATTLSLGGDFGIRLVGGVSSSDLAIFVALYPTSNVPDYQFSQWIGSRLIISGSSNGALITKAPITLDVSSVAGTTVRLAVINVLQSPASGNNPPIPGANSVVGVSRLSAAVTVKDAQTINFANPGSVTLGTSPVLTATASSGLPPVFTSTTAQVCTITTGGALTLVSAGTCTINADQAGNAGFTAAPQVQQSFAVVAPAGACGSANNVAVSFAPAANLCSVGTPSAVMMGSPWTWSCTGGGQPASCSAPNAATSTGTGEARAAVAGGTWAVDTANTAGFIPATGHAKSPPNLPPGYVFPHGLFDFVLNAGAPGSTASITITYPAALPAGMVYWKYGPSPAGFNCSGAGCAAAHWYQMPAAQAVFTGNTVTLTIVDGDVGDDDLTANGVIVDAGGPGLLVAVPGGTVAIPTLSEWALILLSTLMALFGWRRLRGRSEQ